MSGFVLSQTDRRPMYLQIMDQIKHKVLVGDWPPGYALPSIRELAATTSVSVITIKRAYFELERAGWIYTQQARGSFIAENVAHGTQLETTELDEHLEKAVSTARLLGLEDQAVIDRLEMVLKK